AHFLSTGYKRYLSNAINTDVISLSQILRKGGNHFINRAHSFFSPENDPPGVYYKLRAWFNNSDDPAERSELFVYVHRHGYNGLCRYSASGVFNVPFGRYHRPYCPRKEMLTFHLKAQRAKFTCLDFRKVFARARQGTVVYADPPYVPLSDTAYFTHYSRDGFDLREQEALTQNAQRLAKRGVPVLISNHDTPFTRKAYRNAKLTGLTVTRSISCKGNQRIPAPEVLALFS